ncbi:hypothetical protein B0J17DRAFT_676344 [Rhizoctonia solani]|nr:hypothetical protein B0J17DRAFT_676344 [Rhizoctonia solani]
MYARRLLKVRGTQTAVIKATLLFIGIIPDRVGGFRVTFITLPYIMEQLERCTRKMLESLLTCCIHAGHLSVMSLRTM